MEEFTKMEQLAEAKTREDIVKWAAEMQKCPYDFGGEAFDEALCKNGEDAEQCNQCWIAALKNYKCKGEEEEKPRKTCTRKSKEPKEELAAKDSNAGVLALKELSKSMTKEEFMEHAKTVTPSNYGYPDGTEWETVVEALEFKDVETPKEEVTPMDTTELVAPTNDVKVLGCVDKLVEEVKNLQAQQKQWDELFKCKVDEAKAKVEEEKQKLQRAIDYNMVQITTLFPQLEAKDTKTQKSVKVISGQVVLKKASQKLDYDKDKLLAYVKENELTDFIKTTEEVKWGDFKKTLKISEGSIIDANGEVLNVDGLTITEVEEKLEVK